MLIIYLHIYLPLLFAQNLRSLCALRITIWSSCATSHATLFPINKPGNGPCAALEFVQRLPVYFRLLPTSLKPEIARNAVLYCITEDISGFWFNSCFQFADTWRTMHIDKWPKLSEPLTEADYSDGTDACILKISGLLPTPSDFSKTRNSPQCSTVLYSRGHFRFSCVNIRSYHLIQPHSTGRQNDRIKYRKQCAKGDDWQRNLFTFFCLALLGLIKSNTSPIVSWCSKVTGNQFSPNIVLARRDRLAGPYTITTNTPHTVINTPI